MIIALWQDDSEEEEETEEEQQREKERHVKAALVASHAVKVERRESVNMKVKTAQIEAKKENTGSGGKLGMLRRLRASRK